MSTRLTSDLLPVTVTFSVTFGQRLRSILRWKTSNTTVKGGNKTIYTRGVPVLNN